jgi:hypothetical protein
MGYMWAQMVEVAIKKIAKNEGDKEFLEAKIETGKFFMNKMLPYHYGLLASIVGGAKPVMGMKEAAF